MGAIIDQSFLEMLKTMSLRIQLTLKNGNLGNKRSRSTGSSVEFSDYKEYLPGDDFRRIDWNAYGRFEKVYVKLFMQEQESPVSIFLDSSASMDYDKKREIAVKVAATFSYVSLADYDTVSMALFNSKIIDHVLNLRGGNNFNRILRMLEESEFSGRTDLLQTIQSFQPQLKKGITVMISDLMFGHELEKVLRLLSFKKQRVILCHILSEAEINPIFEENMQLIDMESNDKLDIDTGIEAINLYKNKFTQYINDIQSTCKKYKAEYLLINANEPIEQFMKQVHGLT